MGRLIDEDELIKGRVENDPVVIAAKCAPTAFDPDRVVEQLENEQKFWEHAYDRDIGKEKARSYAHAIEIVKGGGMDDSQT